MKTLSRSLVAGLCTYGMLNALSLPAQAQDADQSDLQKSKDAPEDEAKKMGVVYVTAQRRSESLQEVPVTVTAFDAEQIEAARIQQIGDIASRTPGLSFDAFPASQPRLFVRGIGSSDRGAAGDPSSAVFLDEIYLGRPAMVAFDAFDVERIEVLKGPQGTLFGRNVVGGAINVVTKRPDLDEFGAAANLTVGNYNRFDVAGYVNIPFAQNSSAVRVSGALRTHSGYTDNVFLGEDVEDQDTTSIRVQLLSEPTDSLRLHFSVDGTRDRSKGPANHVLELDASDPLSNFYSQNFDPDVTYGSTLGFQNRDTYGGRAEISNDFSFGTLSFLASYRELDYAADYDFDGGNADPLSPGFNQVNISSSDTGSTDDSKLSSQEIRLSSLPESNWDWVFGLYHYAQDAEVRDRFQLDSALIAPIPLLEVNGQSASLDSYAIFGDLSVPIGDRWSVFGGLRYTKDEKTYRVWNTDSIAPLRADEFFDVTTSAEYDAWTYRLGAQFQINSDHMLYGSVSRGFKSGGFQETPENAVDAATPFDPEYATQFELGQKSVFNNGDIIWNNTVFYLDYTDLQTRQTNSAGGIITSNAGAATIQGYETQLNWTATDNFDFAFAYAYTDATFDEFFDNGVDYSGNRLSRAPEHKLSFTPTYSRTFDNGVDMTIAVDYRYESRIFDDNSNKPPEIRDPSQFIDGRLNFKGFPNGMNVSLWGKNLTDERTRTFQALFLGANFGAFSPPRTFGITVGWEY